MCVVGATAILLLAAVLSASVGGANSPTGSEARPMDLYVATNGRDAWPGTREEPFASLERAREAIRQLKSAGQFPAGGVTVRLREGIYPRADTFVLTAEDSGTAEAPIVYRAEKDERVRLIGGRPIRGFTPVTDPAVLARLAEPDRGKVMQVDLKAQGVADLGHLSSRGFGRPKVPAHLQLFFRGREMTLARWPNEGFLKIAGVPAGSGTDDGHGGQLGALEAGFHYEGDRPKRWQDTDDIWVHGYWAYDWANTYEQIASIDTERRLVKTKPPYAVYGFRPGQRIYFVNILEELDQPGEYYVDRQTGLLYFWPPAPLETGEAYVSLLEAPLVSLKSVSHVTLRGLTFEYTRGDAVDISGGTGDLVAGCTLRNLGNWAVVIDGGAGHGVTGCDIYGLGDGGIQLAGGDRQTLAPAGHFATNNHIHHMGQWTRCYQPAVMVTGVGNRVANNLIHDGPHSAIQLGGNEHVIELNEIHHVCLETGDVGAFYMGRDWTQQGNIVRYNYFHDTGGVGMGSMAVYLDDCTSGVTIFGNIFYRTTRAAFIGGGRDNTVENNIFIECNPSVWVDGRGLDPSPVWRNMIYQTMKERLEAMNYHQPPYRERYPKLAELDKYYAQTTGVPPEGNTVVRNVSVGGKWLETLWHAEPAMVDVRDNLVDEDPHFVAPGRRDFRLKPDSPAYALGFQPIPVEKIGLYRDEYRRFLPIAR
jgi:hypothetical protein